MTNFIKQQQAEVRGRTRRRQHIFSADELDTLTATIVKNTLKAVEDGVPGERRNTMPRTLRTWFEYEEEVRTHNALRAEVMKTINSLRE